MKIKLKYLFFTLIAVLLLTVASCRKEKFKLVSLSGIIDDTAEEDESKVYLSDRERWLRWENGDQIFVVSAEGPSGIYDLEEDSHKQLTGTFTNTTSDVTANTTLYAFYPTTMATESSDIDVSDGQMTLILPRCHFYRSTTAPTEPYSIPDPDPDFSFGKGAIPMVAYRPANDDHDLFFHSLAGILRFQLYGGSALSEAFAIDSIIFEAQDQRLSGAFTITKTAIEDNQPYITPVSGWSTDGKSVSISGEGNTSIGISLGGGSSQLFTFYLPLPAIANPYGTGPHYTTYNLKLYVYGKQGGATKYFVRTFKADIRRLSLTMMQAIEINRLVTSLPGAGGDGGSGTPTIVGCGTEDRPFQIYTAQQLAYLRDRMNDGETVNGQTIYGTDEAKPTYIKICRSDINLISSSSKGRGTKEDLQGTSVVWTEGFRNFKGVMYFSSAAGENGGITNISDHPLFESISMNGKVEGVYVKGSKTLTSGTGTFSPMCGVNNGTMTDCHNRCSVKSKSGHNLAGLCCENHGTITGGANDTILESTGGNVAGICYSNSGTLQGNFSLSTSIPKGTNIAGICYENKSGGTVENCQVSANIPTISSSGNWGVVVYENNGTVTNCRSVGTIVFTTSGSIGGVVHTNSGTINGCSLSVTLRGGSNYVGGIVALMNGGEVRNCSADGDRFIYGIPSGGSSNQATYAGGIVGYLQSGAVYNCYNRCPVTGAVNCGSVLGRIDDGAIIENCWSDYSHDFIGDKSLSRPDQGEIGPFCFSSYAPDTMWNCVLLIKSGYHIRVPWQIHHKVDVAASAAGGGGNLTGTMARFYKLDNMYFTYDSENYLINALSTWVTEYSASCWTWTNSTAGYPVFNPAATSKQYRHVTLRHPSRKAPTNKSHTR